MHSARSSANCRVMRSAFPSSSCLDAPNVGSSYSFWTVGPKLIGPRSPCHASACGSQACQAMPKALGVGSSYPFGYSVGSQRCTKMLTHNRAQSFFPTELSNFNSPGCAFTTVCLGSGSTNLAPVAHDYLSYSFVSNELCQEKLSEVLQIDCLTLACWSLSSLHSDAALACDASQACQAWPAHSKEPFTRP